MWRVLEYSTIAKLPLKSLVFGTKQSFEISPIFIASNIIVVFCSTKYCVKCNQNLFFMKPTPSQFPDFFKSGTVCNMYTTTTRLIYPA